MKMVTSHTNNPYLHVTSPAFDAQGEMPRKYSCEGINVSPSLEIKGIPMGTGSLAIVVEDPDAPSGTWTHWVVWNIPPTPIIHEAEVPGVQGVNDFGVNLYGGPCPPSGTHHYHFKVYALDKMLDLPPAANKLQLEFAMDNHILAYGELVGRYKKARHLAFT
jgi:Raf kinase inhibitor-like YbhB/YbcL family protein